MRENYNWKSYSLITKKVIHLSILTICYNGFSQKTIKGKIISEVENFEELLVINSIRNKYVKIDTLGFFEITGFLNDTIKITSNSYDEAKFVIKEKHFNNISEITLKNNIKNLKEIIIDANNINDKKLAEINQQFQSQLKNDAEINPFLYENPDPYNTLEQGYFGGNLFEIVPLAIKLIRKKVKAIKEAKDIYVTQKDLNTYFKNDQRFLISDLNILQNNIPQFFLFIEQQKVSEELLLQENKFFFMEELLQLKDGFSKGVFRI